MGNALVMFTTPEESVARREGDERRRRKRQGLPPPEEPPYRLLPAPREGAIWQPPSEPWEKYGHDWHRNPVVRREHLHAVRASLEEFLNGHLARLNHMVRTGWFVLGRVRVRVVECRPVPEHVMRAQTRGLPRRKPKIGNRPWSALEGRGEALSPDAKAVLDETRRLRKDRSKNEWPPARIKRLRTKLGCTQAELARKVGVSRSAVSRWERGKVRPSALDQRRLDMQEFLTAREDQEGA